MISKQSESRFKEVVLRDLKEAFPTAYILKTQERGRRGVPDILAGIHGLFVAIELKKDTGVATELQLHILRKISNGGNISFLTMPQTWGNDFFHLKQRIRRENRLDTHNLDGTPIIYPR